MNFRTKRMLDSLVRNRNRSNKEIDSILTGFEKRKADQARPKTLKMVRNGQFIRLNLPPRQHVPEIPKLPPSPMQSPPKPLQSLPPKAESAAPAAKAGQQGGQQEWFREYLDRIREFLQLNGPVIIMNAGSLCTLLAFTRTDVLQLRVLSVSGSLCFIVYTMFTPPIKWLSIGWTSLFASVNSWKIVEIINERHSHVEMTEDDEECYLNYFSPHGITPKQFDAIQKSAKRIKVKKGEVLVKQGQKLEHIYLVAEGSTRASILGRYLTAASSGTTSAAPVDKEYSTSGSWVGEMAFLESYWEKEQGKEEPDGSPNRTGTAMYTVVAKEDCVVWQWSHAKMEKLLAKSSDMRAALTRAMTSAIVGKVVNFTVSRTTARPSWQAWLDGWKQARNRATTANYAPEGEQAGEQGSNNDTETRPSDVGKESPA